MHALQELADLDQWIIWRYETRAGNKTPTKVPYDARTGRRASSTDPATWSSFSRALAACAANAFAGVGFVFHEDDPYTGVDLDNCITSQGLDSLAQRLLCDLNSYAEISPSGRGVKCWVHGALARNLPQRPLPGAGFGIELYDHARFFTVTGQRVPGAPAAIQSAQAALEGLAAVLDPPRASKRRTTSLGATGDGRAALAAQFTRVALAANGQRNSQLNRAAFVLGRYVAAGQLDQALVEQWLLDACQENGLGHEEPQACDATIASGLRAGVNAGAWT